MLNKVANINARDPDIANILFNYYSNVANHWKGEYQTKM